MIKMSRKLKKTVLISREILTRPESSIKSF